MQITGTHPVMAPSASIPRLVHQLVLGDPRHRDTDCFTWMAISFGLMHFCNINIYKPLNLQEFADRNCVTKHLRLLAISSGVP
jgi:hypothetical protein